MQHIEAGARRITSVSYIEDAVESALVGAGRPRGRDLSAFGGYASLVQSGANTLITFANGRTMMLKNVTATAITDATFIGLSGGLPGELSSEGKGLIPVEAIKSDPMPGPESPPVQVEGSEDSSGPYRSHGGAENSWLL